MEKMLWFRDAWLPWRSPYAEPEFHVPALDPQHEIDRCLNCDRPPDACDYCGNAVVGKTGRKPIFVDLHKLREMMDSNCTNDQMRKALGGICEGTLVKNKKIVKKMLSEGKKI